MRFAYHTPPEMRRSGARLRDTASKTALGRRVSAMHSVEMKASTAFVSALVALALCSPACSSDDEALDLPEISSFASSPSDQFLIDSTGLALVSRAHPYKGAGSGCAHEGAHLHFEDTGSDYTVDVFAPVAGTISRVD